MKVLHTALVGIMLLAAVVHCQNVAKTCQAGCGTFQAEACLSSSSFCNIGNTPSTQIPFQYIDSIYKQTDAFGSIVNSTYCRNFMKDFYCASALRNLNVTSCSNGVSLPLCYNTCTIGLATCMGFSAVSCSIAAPQYNLAAEGDTNCKTMDTLSATPVSTIPQSSTTPGPTTTLLPTTTIPTQSTCPKQCSTLNPVTSCKSLSTYCDTQGSTQKDIYQIQSQINAVYSNVSSPQLQNLTQSCRDFAADFACATSVNNAGYYTCEGQNYYRGCYSSCLIGFSNCYNNAVVSSESLCSYYSQIGVIAQKSDTNCRDLVTVAALLPTTSPAPTSPFIPTIPPVTTPSIPISTTTLTPIKPTLTPQPTIITQITVQVSSNITGSIPLGGPENSIVVFRGANGKAEAILSPISNIPVSTATLIFLSLTITKCDNAMVINVDVLVGSQLLGSSRATVTGAGTIKVDVTDAMKKSSTSRDGKSPSFAVSSVSSGSPLYIDQSSITVGYDSKQTSSSTRIYFNIHFIVLCVLFVLFM